MAYKKSLASQLSTAVVRALVSGGVTQTQLLSGPIKHDDLPWQVPALLVEGSLGGTPLSEYLDPVMSFNPEALYLLWTEALMGLKNHPDKVLSPDGYKATSYALPNVRACERQLRLSIPEGYPEAVSDFAGIVLSLECAHLLRYNTKLKAFEQDDDNYYAVLPDGSELGVKEGLPALHGDVWDLPVAGMVQDLLSTPRGAVWEGCDYNIISKVRSEAVELGAKLKELDGIDWALQTLRLIDGPTELLAAVRAMPTVAHTHKRRHSCLGEACEVSKRLSLTDRQRIEILKSLLVPESMTAAQFSKTIYPFHRVPPAMLSEKVLLHIQHAVSRLWEDEQRLHAQKK